jgi:hypothetical protein
VKKVLVPFVLVALVAVVAAGCGGGSSKNKAYANSVSGYAAALDSICAPLNAKIKAIGATGLAGIAAHGDEIKSTIQTGVDKIDKLQPPDQVKSAVDDFVAKNKEAIGKFDGLIAAAKAGDSAKAQQIAQEIVALDNATNQDARTIGAAQCAHGG